MNENMLPLGSVVYLKNGTVPLLIISRQPIAKIDSQEFYFDYSGVSQLTGFTPGGFAYFNQVNIDRVIHLGYKTEYEDLLLQSMAQWREQTEIQRKDDI